MGEKGRTPRSLRSLASGEPAPAAPDVTRNRLRDRNGYRDRNCLRHRDRLRYRNPLTTAFHSFQPEIT